MFGSGGSLRSNDAEKSGLVKRVQSFHSKAVTMISRLESAIEKIDDSSVNKSFVETLRLSCAELISEGDTLVLDTHGRHNDLSQVVMQNQTILRDRYSQLNHSKYGN